MSNSMVGSYSWGGGLYGGGYGLGGGGGGGGGYLGVQKKTDRMRSEMRKGAHNAVAAFCLRGEVRIAATNARLRSAVVDFGLVHVGEVSARPELDVRREFQRQCAILSAYIRDWAPF